MLPKNILVLLVAVLATTACITTSRSAVVPLPVGVWTTRPLPCGYEEIALIHAEGPTAVKAAAKALGWLYASPAEALVDYSVARREVPGGGSIFTITALAVKWVGDACPTRPATLQEAMKERESLPTIDDPPAPVEEPQEQDQSFEM